MDKLEKVCPMAQSQGCLMQKCLFFNDEKVICMFLHQHLTILRNHVLSSALLQSDCEMNHIFESLDAEVGLPLLEDAAKIMVSYLEFLGRLVKSPHFPQMYKDQAAKIRLDLERALSDYAFS